MNVGKSLNINMLLKLKEILEKKITELENELTFLKTLYSTLDEIINSYSSTVAPTARTEAARTIGTMDAVRRATEIIILKNNSGDVELGIAEVYDDEIVLRPKIGIRSDGVFERFFVRKVLDRYRADVGIEYHVETWEDRNVAAVIVRNCCDEWRRRDVIRAFRWTLEMAMKDEGAMPIGLSS